MKEAQILFKISEIVSTVDCFNTAVDRIRSLLIQAVGALELAALDTNELSGHELLAAQLQHRAVHAVPLRAGGRELGKLIACYATSESHAAIPHRISTYVGEQLGMLLERTRFRQDGERLEAELHRLRDDLATRKAVQRAQGILVMQRGITPASARRWISERARETASSVRQVAEAIVIVENERRSAEESKQRIVYRGPLPLSSRCINTVSNHRPNLNPTRWSTPV